MLVKPMMQNYLKSLQSTSADSSNSSASKFITVAEISPLPKNIRSNSQRRQPSAKATLSTNSPHKKRVKEQFEIQKIIGKEASLSKKNRNKSNKSKQTSYN